MTDGSITIKHSDGTSVTTTLDGMRRAADRLGRTEFDHSPHGSQSTHGPRSSHGSASEYDPDGNGPGIDGTALASALKFALVACPSKDENALLSHVIVRHDTVYSRLEIGACDTHRWHVAHVPVPEDMEPLGTRTWPRDDARRLVGLICTARAVGEYAVVRSAGEGRWAIAYGQPSDIEAVIDTDVGANWNPPAYQYAGGAGGAAYHDAKHVAEAMALWQRKGVRVALDSVDSGGRRHISLVDASGVELARAILVQLGFTEGEPASKQAEIPGALGAADRVRTPEPPAPPVEEKPKRASKAKVKPVAKKARR